MSDGPKGEKDFCESFLAYTARALQRMITSREVVLLNLRLV